MAPTLLDQKDVSIVRNYESILAYLYMGEKSFQFILWIRIQVQINVEI
jgi:hypothetical protein